MIKLIPSLLVTSVLALGLGLAPAHALNTRSFISANGVDTNPCIRPAPCRTLQKAHDSTNPGGEINMLDPAGYGPVTITKSISIVNDGVGSAGILATGGNGITINANANDKINLRGLIIEGAGTGATGISFASGGALNVQNSVIRGFTLDGINFQPGASSKLFVSSTLVADNGASGIRVQPTGSGTVTARLNRVELDNNGSAGVAANGNFSTGAVKVIIVDSVAANNVNFGFASFSGVDAAATSVMLVRCVAVNNNYGILVQGTGATLRSAQSTVTGNNIAWDGTPQSYGNNVVAGNASGGGAMLLGTK